jgi:hypothetical protein
MAIKEEYHNVSVRLKDEDYQKLLFLHRKFGSMSYGKVTLADVLRISVNETWLRESTEPNKPVSNVGYQQQTFNITEEPRQVTPIPNANLSNTPNVNNTVKEVPNNEPELDSLDNKGNDKQKFITELEAAQEEKTESNVKSFDDIEKQLEQYEKELRQATNSKGKPYSDNYITNQLKQKRKELES